MKIRSLISADHAQIKSLFDYCFAYSQPFLNWSIEKSLAGANTIVIDDEGKIASCAALVPYTLSVHNQNIDSAYLCSIATQPEYRRRGMMRELLSASLNSMYMQNKIINFLIPFEYKVFEKYGWRTTYHYKQYNISMADIPSFRVKGTIEKAQLADESFSKLNMIYAKFTSDKNSYTIRTIENWRLIMEDLMINFGGYCALLTDEFHAPCGYVMYLIHGDTMKVYELAYTNFQAYESLCAFIKNHSAQVKQVSMKAPEDDLMHLYFSDNRDCVTLCPFAMARVVNVKKALEMIHKDCEREFRIQIIDRFFKENNAIYLVNRDAVTAVEEEPDCTTDIGTFTQLFMGSLSVGEAYKLNMLTGNQDLLTQIFLKENNYINMLCM